MNDTGKTGTNEVAAAAAGEGVGVSASRTRQTIPPSLRPLDVIETRTLAELLADGDQNGARVIVVEAHVDGPLTGHLGKLGTIRSLPVFGATSSRPLGHTSPVRLELDELRAALIPLEPADYYRVLPFSRVRCKADGRHGIAYQDTVGLLFLPEGAAFRDRLPVMRGDVEAVGNFDPRIVSSLRVEEGPAHDHVHVWNRGGKAGELVVQRGDGETLMLALTETLAGRMCAGRGAAAKALRDAGADFDKVQSRLEDLVRDLDDGLTLRKALTIDAAVRELRDLIVSLGDASCAASVSAKRVEREIGRAP